MVLEAVASVYGLCTAARRWGNCGKLKLLHLLSAITIPSLANLELATLASFKDCVSHQSWWIIRLVIYLHPLIVLHVASLCCDMQWMGGTGSIWSASE
jgi:hypothetical protein